MASGVGTVLINIVGNADRLRAALGEAEESTRSLGERVGDVGKKMTLFATVPVAAFLGSAAKAAVEDADAQAHLAHELENATGANKAQVAAAEAWISKAMKMSTFTDDELRPSLETLARSTNDLGEAQKLQAIAMDIAAAKGIPLEVATLAVAKAHEGQFAAVNKLVPGLVDLKDKTLTVDDVTKKLAETFNGSAIAATETIGGKAKNAARDMGELKESIGQALLPILSNLLELVQPVIDQFTAMDEGTQKTIVVVGLLVAAIGPLIGVIGALSTAMTFLAANPIVLIIAGIALLVAALVIAYQKSETFRDIVNGVFQAVVNGVADAIGWILDGISLLIGGLARVAEAASSLPGIGDKFKGIAETLRGAQHDVDGWSDAMHKGIDLVASDAERAKKAFEAVGQAAKLDLGNIGQLGLVASMGRPGTAPARAGGGPVWPGQAFLVGEQGPELFVPGQAGRIVPGGQGGGGNVYVTVNGWVGNETELTRKIQAALLAEKSRSGPLGLS